MDPEHHRLLTPAEVAALFRVDPRTVTRWAVSGRLHSIRTPGGHRRFPEKDVLALLEGIGVEPQESGAAEETQGAESPANGPDRGDAPPHA
ncbi:MAG: BldC family transcriptional regulator [Streptosporangiales bacterium]